MCRPYIPPPSPLPYLKHASPPSLEDLPYEVPKGKRSMRRGLVDAVVCAIIVGLIGLAVITLL